ncbi:PEP/pyruvate-binding domain-containing protein [uncultured Fibrella sp.]|uniref:PEP/pyruvate-binding domain-containing protein n=1 Tax=uncultured Fibrella sp. TaxID=1284596 RepID=UPI0035CBCA9D
MICYGPAPRPTYTLGGKATGLYRLQTVPVAVPPFLVIPAETFDSALLKWPATEDYVSHRNAQLLDFTLSEDDRSTISRILANWDFPNRAVVVRSSVADEDGATHAFPGLMDSFLNLTTLSEVYRAVARCAASAYSERAIAYRKQKKIPLAARPAVIIQQQVTPVASGVLFTTFPDYPQEMAAHALFGFGEGLMTGDLDADEFYWLKQAGHMHRSQIAIKTRQLAAHNAADGSVVSVPVSPEKQTDPCLTSQQLDELFRIGTRLENAFQQPLDVEFVVTDKQVFVVQARPITQPIPEVIVYDNSNIQESYCGVTSPLTFSFASRAYATVYRQTMQTLGLPASVIQAHESVVTNLLGLVKGRIYYNINNWYRGLQLLPSFRQNKADMERMMGLEEPVDFVQDTEKSLSQKIAMLPGLLVNLSRLLWAFSQAEKRIPAFLSLFKNHFQTFYSQDFAALTNNELLAQKSLLDSVLLENWSTPIINDFYVMMTNGQVIRKLQKVGVAAPDEFLSRYLSGDKQIESTQPVRAMFQLAAQVRTQPELRALILSGPPDLSGQVRSRFPRFYQAVSQFIDQYGDRTVGELKLETITMRLDPAVFYQYLRNYLTADSLPNSLADTTTALHTEAATELTHLLASRSPFFRRTVWQKLGRLQQAIRYREALRLERTRLFGMYRALYIEAGHKLQRAGALLDYRDIFFLTESEITLALRPTSPTMLTELVASRQREFAAYRSDHVPSRLVVPSPPTPETASPTSQPDMLHGTGCVPGEITGEIIVITDPRDKLDVTGKIVCALRTDPGWAVLFPACRAVLIEKGSSLSHSVILLRELGIPTIINVPGVTSLLQSGQTVTMNGRSGDIKLRHDTN